MRKFAAGALLLHTDPATGDLYTLLQQRSGDEHEPLTWCIYGGMAETGETISECLIREVDEESGIDISGCERVHVHTFDDPMDDFKYHTFVVPVPERVTPIHSHETADARWVRIGEPGDLWGDLPRPLHSGMLRLLHDAQVVAMIELFRKMGKHALAVR